MLMVCVHTVYVWLLLWYFKSANDSGLFFCCFLCALCIHCCWYFNLDEKKITLSNFLFVACDAIKNHFNVNYVHSKRFVFELLNHFHILWCVIQFAFFFDFYLCRFQFYTTLMYVYHFSFVLSIQFHHNNHGGSLLALIWLHRMKWENQFFFLFLLSLFAFFSETKIWKLIFRFSLHSIDYLSILKCTTECIAYYSSQIKERENKFH